MMVHEKGVLYVRERFYEDTPSSRNASLGPEAQTSPADRSDMTLLIRPFHDTSEWGTWQILRMSGTRRPVTEPSMGPYLECMKTATGLTGSGALIVRREATDADIHLFIAHWCPPWEDPPTFAEWIKDNTPFLLERGLRPDEAARLHRLTGLSPDPERVEDAHITGGFSCVA